MAQNDWKISLLGGLDGTKSKSQINSDIKKLEKSLDKIKLTAELDFKDKAQIESIKKQLDGLKISLNSVDISSSAINNLVEKINKGLQSIQVGNINVNPNGAKNAGQVVSQQVQDAIKDVTSTEIEVGFHVDPAESGKFEGEVSKIITDLQKKKSTAISYKLNTKTEFDKDANEYVEKLVNGIFRYTTATGEAITKTVAYDSAQERWVERNATYAKALEETTTKTNSATSALERFENAKKKSGANLLNQAKQSYEAAIDPNAHRSLTQEHKDDLESKYNAITDAINRMKAETSDSAFIKEEINVRRLISEMKIAISHYKNMDNVSQKLKGVNVESGKKIANEDFEKLKSDAKEYSAMASTISDLETELDKIGDSASLNSFNDKLREARAELSKFKAEASAANRSEKVGINKSDFQSKIDDLRKISPEIDKFKTKINGAEVNINSLLEDLSKVNTQGDMSVLNTKWRAFTDAAKAAGIAVRDMGTSSESSAKKIESIQRALEVGDYKTKFESIKSTFENLGLEGDKLEKEIAEVEIAFNKLKNAKSDADFIALDKEFKDAFDKANNSAKQLKLNLDEIYNSKRQSKLSTDIQNWLSKNTKASQATKQTLQEYYRELNGSQVPVSRLEYIEKQLKDIDATQRGLGKLGKSLKDQFKQAAESFTQWLSVSSAVMFLVTKTRQAVVELKEVNTLLTEISKANDKLTKSQLADIGDSAFETASRYGKKATDYLAGVQEMSRAGYQNAEAMSELSVKAQGAGDMTEDVANKFIVATDKAYKLNGSLTDLTKIMDGINYITNHNAINMTELSEGFSIVGSTAASFGVEANELTAALATMGASTQQSGSEVARAFRAILLNIRQVSDEEEGIDAEGLTKYENACNALGVSLKKTVNGVQELRDPMEVLGELSKKYKELSDTDIRKVNLLNSVGGKLRATQLDALLRGWSDYETMLGQFADGAGSMAKEAEKTANSWEGSMNRLSNTWTDTIGNIANSDGVIGLIKSLDWVLDKINKLTGALGSLGSIGLIGGLVASAKNFGRPKIFGLKSLNVLKLPNTISVLSDTKVFLWSNVKYAG